MDITEFARLGGKARAKKLSKERVAEIASNASKARWAKITTKRKSLTPAPR